ncbi:isoleucine--tRNA ligase [Buchnera aphidicola (Thelaxes californica)]|uniref:Isoleucine--tRNA ligase n=1 Tax=Buchnera aphidicola (Thelaxes californica) TaxID=1315998 RepID=A0A4D6YL41_9GAMM|nr:isoleucine--tRNA ligase [Buchnera aphidicola]QCI26670.1 isoleucine--tRNA ligase [Buchnera aphidicola (Thelaxes californica)]
MNNYKNTLNLPHTEFSMRGLLTEKEPKILLKWKKENLYSLIRKSKKNHPSFILQDGPPYANGNIHLGHAVNKILKDIIIKSKNMSEFDAPFIPCWDCHGLPIEHQIEKILKKKKKKVSNIEFRVLCKQYAQEQVEKQKKDFIQLGIIADWNNSQLTMHQKNEANTVRVLYEIIKNGYMYEQLRPVHWCSDCNSALADTELEYQQKNSPSITILFESKDATSILNEFHYLHNNQKKIFIAVWTTTPWTLPANQAIAIHPEFTYQLIETEKFILILEQKIVKKLLNSINIKKWKICSEIKGKKLEKKFFIHPFLKFTVPIILSKYIEPNTGTGAVHIAPDHGYEDYILAQKYNINTKNLVDERGKFKKNIHPLLNEIDVFKANKIIINILKKEKKIILSKKILHSYPCCWRHKKKIIFRATPQWFIKINHKTLQSYAHKTIESTNWIPNWGKERMLNLVSNRPDWCISRQRNWGVPLFIFINKKTRALHPNTLQLLKEFIKKIEKEGIDFWWNTNIEQLLQHDSNKYIKVTDILDVWFESGAMNIKTIYKNTKFHNERADIYLEGSDQYRGWFMSSLIIANATIKTTPFKTVISHGFTIDKTGQKMSKSLGNTISPDTIVKTMGADILRLWVASSDHTKDIVISTTSIQQICDTYRKIRNTIRFFLANLYDFNPKKDSIPINQMIELDQWAINLTQVTQKKIIHCYEHYNFHNIVNIIMQFCSIDMSSFYLDIIKDRLYTTYKDSSIRKSSQTTLYIILQALVRWIAPILSFTADEIWNFIPQKNSNYIFTESWFTQLSIYSEKNSISLQNWNCLILIRNGINKILEEYRKKKIIKNSLEICIYIYTGKSIQNILKKLKTELKFILLTSKVIIKNYECASSNAHKINTIQNIKISLKIINGIKCPRCWHYHLNNEKINTKKIQTNNNLCTRCTKNIKGPYETRLFV